MTFSARLRAVQKERHSLVCIGLDPDPSLIPAGAGSVLDFNRRMIASTHDLVCCYKMNLAFYEALGDDGWRILRATLREIPDSALTIGDGKRGDIGNTAERYAFALFSDLGFDAITVNPYMGFDAIEPFLKDTSCGVFVLALTSNPGSRDFQRLKIGSSPLYKKVISAAKKWNSGGNVGLVVGATHPKELREVRKLAPEMPFLIPGIGAQGGDLNAAVRFGCDSEGLSALINVGRSVLYASGGSDFEAAARKETMKIRDHIRMIQADVFGL